MLRTLIVALAIAVPGLASAQQAQQSQFNNSAVGIEVRGDDGTVIGRVASVERDANGRIVAAEIPGQEPGSAPYASSELVAERNEARILINDRERNRSNHVVRSSRAVTR
jgi:hypothetical protein